MTALSRFRCLVFVALSVALSTSGMPLFADERGPGNPGIAVQLWSVKDELQQDYKGTLKALADMGFEGVEFAGNFGPRAEDPAGLKDYMDSLGLKAAGAHVGFADMSDDTFDETVAFYSALGCTNLIVPMDHRAFDAEQVDWVVAELDRLAEKLAPLGMRTGYHNHPDEFASFKGRTFWDYIAANTSERVIMQLDVGHAVYAGKSPSEYVRRYPGRTVSTHIKGRLPEGSEGHQPFIGQDTINWIKLLETFREVGGTEWLIVEQEDYPGGMGQVEAVRVSLEGLKAFLSSDDISQLESKFFDEARGRNPISMAGQRVFVAVSGVEFSRSWEQSYNKGIDHGYQARMVQTLTESLDQQLRESFTEAGFTVVAEPSNADLRAYARINELFTNAPERSTISESYARVFGSATYDLIIADSSGDAILRLKDNRETRDRFNVLEKSWRGRVNKDFENLFRRWTDESVSLLSENSG